MANADGSIIVNVDLDDKQAQKELNALTKKIDGLNEKIYQKKHERMPLVEQAKQLGAELDAAKAKLEYMNSGKEFFTSAQIKNQTAAVQEMQTEWNGVQKQVEKYDTDIQKSTVALERAEGKAGEIQQQLAAAGVNGDKMAAATEKANKGMTKFSLRLREVVRSALVFTIITQALARFREWLGKVVKSNAEASAAIARLKGALLTLAQPIVNIIIPAFTTFVNILTSIINAISSLLSMLFGSTIDQSKEAAENLYNETDAIEGVGGAAKKASKSLASFDEINKLSGGSSESGDGGTGGISEKPIKPDFGTTGIETGLERILNLAKLIGATILAWGLGKGFLDSLKKFFGFLIAIDGAVRFIKNFFDAWNNGLSWENIRQMLLGMAELAIGLAIALGPVAAGISLIITGLAILALGFKDAFENGWNLQNLLLSVAGILATGIGISLLTGSWIPALIAGIAALLLAITVAYGDGEALLDGFKTILEGFKNFILGVFTGDIERAIQGIGEIFGGLQTVISVVLDAVKNMFNSFLDWLDEKTHGRLSGLIEWIRSFINSHIETVKTVLLSFVAAMEQIFTGILNFLSGVFTGDWDMAWQGIKEIFGGVINGIISLFEGMANMVINGLNSLISEIKTGLIGGWNDIKNWWETNVSKYFTIDYWLGLGKNVVNGFINGIKSIGTGALKWATGIIDDIKDGVGTHSPSKKTQSVGQYTVDGFILGIQNRSPLLQTTLLQFSSMVLGQFDQLSLDLLTKQQDTQMQAQTALSLWMETVDNLFLVFFSGLQFRADVWAANLQATLDRMVEAALAAAAAIAAAMSSAGGGSSSGSSGKSTSGKSTRTFSLTSAAESVRVGIPALARGAVIPPNREFMAVLEDQKSGTNIETPLATMVQAFKMAMQETGMGGNSTIIMEVDSQQFAKVVYKANKSESRRIGVRLVEV